MDFHLHMYKSTLVGILAPDTRPDGWLAGQNQPQALSSNDLLPKSCYIFAESRPYTSDMIYEVSVEPLNTM